MVDRELDGSAENDGPDGSDDFDPKDLPNAEDLADEGATSVHALPYSSIAPISRIYNGPAGRVDVAVIGLRLLAVYYVASAAPSLIVAPFLALSDYGPPFNFLISTLLPVLVNLLLGVSLWLLSKPVARWMLANVPTTSESPRSRLSAPHAQSLAFSVVGLVLAAYAARHLATLFAMVTEPRRGGIVTDNAFLIRRTVIDLAVELVVAALVFFGAHGLCFLWHRARATP